MKVTNGTDIVEIKRIKKDIELNGDKFLKRLFTDKEIEYCESKKVQKFQSYAARFAAKEATYKALSDYIDFPYTWKDFEVVNEENGKPIIKLNFKIDQLENLEISLSHCKEYAIANAVAIYKER